MGDVNKRISIVVNMSEERLRKLIREEVRLALGEERSMEITLGNPSTASLIPTWPFPALKAEAVRERIEKLEREAKVGMSWDLLSGEEEVRVLGYTLDELRGMIAFAISRGWSGKGEGEDAEDPG